MPVTSFKPAQINPGKTVVKSQEILQTFSSGELIFSQGDSGGDLLFIDSGDVEIFITKDQQETVLTSMKAGEIIGVMTFLTRDPRMASARALSHTVIRKIPSVHVQSFIKTFPKWLKIVLKEFVGRINEMNKRFSDTSLELRKAREMQITPLFLATQMAQALSPVGRGCVYSKDGASLVKKDELNSKMQLVLNQPKRMVDFLISVFEDTGLLNLTSDLEKKERAYSIETLDRVAVFTQFVRESSQGTTKKLVKANFSADELSVLKNISSSLIKKGNPIDKSGVLVVFDLIKEFEDSKSIPLKMSFVEKISKLGLVELNEGEKPSMTLTPLIFNRTLSCLEAMQKLVVSFEAKLDDAQEV